MADQLDIFGFDASQLEAVKINKPKNVSEVFNNIAADMVYCLQQSVRKEKLVYQGKLEESIKMPIKVFGQKMVATLYMAEYYDYVNKGVRGIGGKKKTKDEYWNIKAPDSPYQFKKGPSVSHMRQWAKSKGINEYIARNFIAYEGIRPRHFFDNCMKETFYGEAFNKFKTDIRIVAGEKVTKGLKEIIKK